jgi:hypothetical protein
MRAAHLIALVVLALPATVAAQAMPAEVRGRGPSLSLSDGEPISFVLEHASSLDLTDGQRTGLMLIRRRLRIANEPFMRQLDSLRESLGLDFEQPRPRGISDEDRRKLQRLEQLSRPITDSMKVNNDAARLEARGLLDSAQVVRLDSLVLLERGMTGGRRPPPRR